MKNGYVRDALKYIEKNISTIPLTQFTAMENMLLELFEFGVSTGQYSRSETDYNDGYQSGYRNGYDTGHDEAEEEAKQKARKGQQNELFSG